MDFGYLQSFLFSEDNTNNTSSAREVVKPRRTTVVSPPPPSSRDIEIGNEEFTSISLRDNTTIDDNNNNNNNEGNIKQSNTLSHSKVSFVHTLSNLSGRISSLVSSKANTAEPVDEDDYDDSKLEEGSKTVASSTESETSDSSNSETAKDNKPSRGRSSSRRRNQRRSSSRARSTSSDSLTKEDNDIDDDDIDDHHQLQIDHIRCFAHGRVWTCLGIFFSWVGFFLSYLARTSTEFVTVDPPIYFDPNFHLVEDIGMIHLRLCFNESYIGHGGCTIQELATDDVDDRMFQLSRSVAFLAVLFGGIMSSFLTIAVVWHSINLRPVGVGFLMAYFLQSFCFLFFDSSLCNKQTCTPGSGAKCAIVASLCWIGACVATSRMDAFKFRQRKLKLRKLRRKRRRRRKQQHEEASRSSSSPRKQTKIITRKALNRGVSNATAKTATSNGSSSSSSRGFVQESLEELPVRTVVSKTKKPLSPTITIEGIDDMKAAQAWVARSNLEQGGATGKDVLEDLMSSDTTSNMASSSSSPRERQQRRRSPRTSHASFSSSAPTSPTNAEADILPSTFFQADFKELPPPSSTLGSRRHRQRADNRSKSSASGVGAGTSVENASMDSSLASSSNIAAAAGQSMMMRNSERTMSSRQQSRGTTNNPGTPPVITVPRSRTVEVNRNRSSSPRKRSSGVVVHPPTSSARGRSSDPNKPPSSSSSRRNRSVSRTRDGSGGRGRSSSVNRTTTQARRTRSSSRQRSSSRTNETTGSRPVASDHSRKNVTSPSARMRRSISMRVEHTGQLSPSRRDSELEQQEVPRETTITVSSSKHYSKRGAVDSSTHSSRYASPTKHSQRSTHTPRSNRTDRTISTRETAAQPVVPIVVTSSGGRTPSPTKSSSLAQRQRSLQNQQQQQQSDNAHHSAARRQASPSRRPRQRSLSREPSMRGRNDMTKSTMQPHRPSSPVKQRFSQSPSKRSTSRSNQQPNNNNNIMMPPEPKPSTEESFHSRLFAPFGL